MDTNQKNQIMCHCCMVSMPRDRKLRSRTHREIERMTTTCVTSEPTDRRLRFAPEKARDTIATESNHGMDQPLRKET
ncbi:hypothetical protein PROFUN_05297 [Planoprotostelium fungivorum]|uniref:Uncharacterized protein n=1 Tax=Planoprotostelium fungivorum TaxID=1890364 RepID=A0A2P6NRD2_9EUKA|nr:hypothetical protein PROFUN_05297 [Planoprotostelium fungivorum]